jgi:hypothetical protein
MSDDMLERATTALRDTTSTPPDDAARQRAKLLAQAAKRAKPAPIWQWAAAAFTGSEDRIKVAICPTRKSEAREVSQQFFV